MRLNRGETVECMLIENEGRTIRRDGTMEHVGNMLFDDFLQEAYSVVTKPLLQFKKKKGTPVYLIDRDAGVTVTLEKADSGTGEIQKVTLTGSKEKPLDIKINGKTYAGWTVNLERSEQVIKLNTAPALVGRAIKSEMLREQFSAPLSGREKMIMILIGFIIGGFVGLLF